MNNNCIDEIPLLSASIAIYLAKTLTTDELNTIGNLITAIGAEMMTVAAFRESEKKGNTT